MEIANNTSQYDNLSPQLRELFDNISDQSQVKAASLPRVRNYIDVLRVTMKAFLCKDERSLSYTTLSKVTSDQFTDQMPTRDISRVIQAQFEALRTTISTVDSPFEKSPMRRRFYGLSSTNHTPWQNMKGPIIQKLNTIHDIETTMRALPARALLQRRTIYDLEDDVEIIRKKERDLSSSLNPTLKELYLLAMNIASKSDQTKYHKTLSKIIALVISINYIQSRAKAAYPLIEARMWPIFCTWVKKLSNNVLPGLAACSVAVIGSYVLGASDLVKTT